MGKKYEYETLACTFPSPGVIRVEMNRPQKMNAMNRKFWIECRDVFNTINSDGNIRCVVLSAAGKLFSAGLDLMDLMSISGSEKSANNDDDDDDDSKPDVARKGLRQYINLNEIQESFNAIEHCFKPVIAAVHNGCVGGGVDMISACDIRLCSDDAWFCVKEVDVALAADVGTLQRFPKIVGNDSLVRELCLTARKFTATEALTMGFVSRVCGSREATIKAAEEMAILIASKSPVAVVGTKVNLNYSRDHSVRDGLKFVNGWNMSMLQTKDLPVAAQASFQKGSTPKYSKL